MTPEVADRGMVLLGCGRMGSALLQGWLAGGLDAAKVRVIEPAPSDWLRGSGVRLDGPVPDDPAVALVAVKPQMMADALPRLAGLAQTLFVTVAAGTPIAAYEAALGPVRLVRAMPNTPAAIGAGITALVGNGHATDADVDTAETLLRAVGETVRLSHEDQMDAVTGLSGSGPAYVFHLIEAMRAAGVAQGLDEGLSLRLARATVAGAGRLAAESGETPGALREAVTSPKGTTEAGLGVLMAELPDLMERTVAAAAERSRALRA